jgi:uncharacterized membrane protein
VARQLPFFFFMARLGAAGISIVVLIALLTMPLDANLFYAAIVCIAGCLMMGWLDLAVPAAPRKRG